MWGWFYVFLLLVVVAAIYLLFSWLQRRFGKRAVIAAAVGLAACAIGALIALHFRFEKQEQKRCQYISRFSDHIGAFVGFPELRRIEGQPYIKGKIVTVERRCYVRTGTDARGLSISVKGTEDAIATLGADLPEEIQAADPDEVGTIVWLDYDKQTVGYFSSGGAAYRWICRVTIIDKSLPAVVGEALIAGSEPDQVKSIDNPLDTYGSIPDSKVLEYLSKLPRRP